MADAAKIVLSLIGAILLILLCVEIMGPDHTSASTVFAVTFLVLLAYAVMRFFKKKKPKD
ncbi:hypothetical protein [Cerasicoccus maritimus]|uniref:hypothetical protein n=1 Tax=Cerasicoccus maritimus TaxID=490089 RepID=UPI00285279C1|nr:hypothetical protein [Cerasicoccus maritimus]